MIYDIITQVLVTLGRQTRVDWMEMVTVSSSEDWMALVIKVLE